ncbi:hypothetical protein M8J75_003110 [Diaphorina citri]|nr:hypothetical protein M8J75_003110 [Diaphorina citri]
MAKIPSLAEEEKLVELLNEDVVTDIQLILDVYGQVFAARNYDQVPVRGRKKEIINKMKFGFGLFEMEWSETPKDKEKAKKADEKNEEKCNEIIDIVLKETKCGLDNIFMNYVMVLHVKAGKKQTRDDIKVMNLFRFAKFSKHDKPCDNLFIGGDLRLYQNWADFVENNLGIEHDSIVFAPAGGAFSYLNGTLQLDIFHVSRFMRTYVNPVLTGVGLVGTGMLCVSLPPIGAAIGVGAAGLGAVGGASFGIADLVDRGKHNQLFTTSSLLPTLDIVSSVLFAHSAVGALKLSTNTVINSQKFLQCALFTEKALRVGAISRLSVDILSTMIAFSQGNISWKYAAARIFSSCLFLFNLYVEEIEQTLIPMLMNRMPQFLNYENVQPFLRYSERIVGGAESLPEFAQLFSILLDNLHTRNRFSVSNVTQSLRRLLNIKWNIIMSDVKRAYAWACRFFARDDYMSNFRNVQMAVVYTLLKTLESHVLVEESDTKLVDALLDDLMDRILRLWKRMCVQVYNVQCPEIMECTMVMRFLVRKINDLRKDEGSVSNPSGPLPVREFFSWVHDNLPLSANADITALCEECKDSLKKKQLQPIRDALQHKFASISFIQQQSNNECLEEVFEDSRGMPAGIVKVDSDTKLGVRIKYMRYLMN